MARVAILGTKKKAAGSVCCRKAFSAVKGKPSGGCSKGPVLSSPFSNLTCAYYKIFILNYKYDRLIAQAV